MKTYTAIFAGLTLALPARTVGADTTPNATTPVTVATPPRAIAPATIKDRISVKRGGKMEVRLKRDGEVLLPKSADEKVHPCDVSVTVSVKDTTNSPFREEGDPTRPYLVIANSSGKALRFRVLTRLKGSQEYYELKEPFGDAHPESNSIVWCWKSGSLVEEVVVFQLAFAPKNSATNPERK